MKCKLILTAALFLTFGFIKAQKNDNIHWGLKAGVNFSSISDMDTKLGFNAGGTAQIQLSNSNWFIQPELIYSLEGGKWKNDFSKGQHNLHFLNLPILLQYSITNGFKIEAGPQIGIMLFARGNWVTFSDGIHAKSSVGGAYTSINFSLPVGISYVSHSGFGIDARYNYGLSDISDASNGVRASTLQLGIFYQLTRKKT